MIKVVDNTTEVVNDMPKLDSPFVREERNSGYYVKDEINEGYEWVFESDSVIAVEKLDGTNVSVVIENGNITAVFNRKNRVAPFNKNKQFITKGLLNSLNRGYLNLKDGQWYGELVGPKVQGNPYKLDEHLWIPFQSYSWRKLKYNSWGDYPKTFDAIKSWFDYGLIPLFYSKIHGVSFDEAMKECKPEGIVFTDTKTKKMAKLRYDMFEDID